MGALPLPMVRPGSAGPRKKQSTGAAKSPGRSEFLMSGDGDGEHNEEVIFLGRKDDEMYICEKAHTTFRILKLSPTPTAS